MHLEPISGSRIRLPEKVQVSVRCQRDYLLALRCVAMYE